jgi:hypothetical protein
MRYDPPGAGKNADGFAGVNGRFVVSSQQFIEPLRQYTHPMYLSNASAGNSEQ